MQESRRLQPHQLRQNLVANIEKQIQFSLPYFLLLILSAVIATVGLVANNCPVVIGSMLLSPLIWSVYGLSLGLVTTNFTVLIQAVKSFLVSITMVLLISLLVTSLIGLSLLPSLAVVGISSSQLNWQLALKSAGLFSINIISIIIASSLVLFLLRFGSNKD